MKMNTVMGIILIVLGVAAFVFQGITYTTRHQAVDLGPIQVTTEQTRTIPLPPIVGAIALAGGIVLLIVEKKRS